MSQDAVEKFLGRLITDDDFREESMNSLSKVCFEQGFDLTAEEQKIIQNLDLKQFIPLAKTLDKGIKRSRSTMKNFIK